MVVQHAALCVALLSASLIPLHAVDAPPPPADVLDIQCELAELLCRLEASPELPTVVIVGHHNDGKSALLEALVGVRLSHVGSSTTTRRPLRVQLQHDSSLSAPAFFLAHAGGDEHQCSLGEVRAHIEAENERLSQRAEVDETFIEVRMRWKHAINVVLIDTPGLLSIPSKSTVADVELQRRSDAVEQIVLRQLSNPSRIILCLEDTSDWQLARTLPVVQRVDPQLSRTVVVAAKLDAKVAQFSMPEDLHRLLNPRHLLATHKGLLAGPIFTSVPPLRGEQEDADSVFAGEVEEHEAALRHSLEERLGSAAYSSRIGVSAVRRAIEPVVCAQWVQLHAHAAKTLEAQLTQLQRQQALVDTYESLEDFAHRYSSAISALLKGSIAIEASEHGETLEQERQASGSGAFCTLARPSATERKRATGEPAPIDLPAGAGAALSEASEDGAAALWMHAGMRLYGGAQYWRAIREFAIGAAEVPEAELTVEEIVNAMGFDGYHDGVNYLRAVCIIVLQRAKGFFEGNLRKLRLRLIHVMSRMSDPVDALLRAEADELSAELFSGGDAQASRPFNAQMHARHIGLANTVYAKFVDDAMEDCMKKCMNDVQAMTKYVSWDFHSGTKDALYNVLIEPISSRLQRPSGGERRGRGRSRRDRREDEARKSTDSFGSYEELVDGLTEILTSRRVSEQMRLLMNDLVREIIMAWREEFCRMISLKFNSFFLMPFCDTLPRYMRRELARLQRESETSEQGLSSDVSQVCSCRSDPFDLTPL
ncbi:hypothetical protein AB1Y20_019473 [Prymnesium parvum]|uniref:Dynamin-type G domain-containing protein n=1 Tax=Prymnesium parvum TaxID=97485 RepID=A0AB34JR94_PRYPA